jgi:hypothetical protein
MDQAAATTGQSDPKPDAAKPDAPAKKK